MKHPDHDISVYIHSKDCRLTGYCLCPKAEETDVRGRVVSCKIRGFMADAWNFRLFLNITQYEIERLADYERFYILALILNGKKIEQRCIDRRDSSTIFVLRPNQNSDPDYLNHTFACTETSGLNADNFTKFSRRWNWLIEIKVSYGKLSSSLSTRSYSQSTNGFMPGSGVSVEENHSSGKDEPLLVHFKFFGCPPVGLEHLRAPKLGPRSLHYHFKAPISDTPSNRDPPERPLPIQFPRDQILIDDASLIVQNGVGWDRLSGLPALRTQTIEVHHYAGLNAASKFMLDWDNISIVNRAPEGDSLITSTGTPTISHPQPRRNLENLVGFFEGDFTGLDGYDQDPEFGVLTNQSTGDKHSGPASQPVPVGFDQIDGKGERVDVRNLETAQELETQPSPRSSWRHSLRTKLNEGIDFLKENKYLPRELDHA